MIRTLILASAVMAWVPPALAGPTRSSPLAVAPDGAVFAVNPDSNTVARLVFSGGTGGLTHEATVGAYPRTLALAGPYVFTADQIGDGITRCDQGDLGGCTSLALGPGCNPYGIAATPAGDHVVVACQGSSEIVLLSTSLVVQGRMKLTWSNARAIAISSDGTRAYVTHFLTEEPGTAGHVSVVDLPTRTVATVFDVAADVETCETQNSGQGVLNLLSAIALIPDGAPPEVAGQLWVGGTQQNNISKGLFKRAPRFKTEDGAGMFPLVQFAAFPEDGVLRNIYRPSFHDITRFGIVKLSAADGTRVGKVDIDEANNATDIEFSADGTTAYVVDMTFNSYHVFNTRKGQGTDVTTLFAGPAERGPGGANASAACTAEPLRSVTSEAPFRIPPQAQITTIDGYDPFDASFTAVPTGVDFDGATFFTSGVSRMRSVPDGIGTSPIGVRLSPDGTTAYVLNYLSRNLVAVGSALPLDGGGKPANLRCGSNPNLTCGTNNDCPSAGAGVCNHPGGSPCNTDADCGQAGPCIRNQDCIPLILAPPVATLTGRCQGGGNPGASCKTVADCTGGTCDGLAADPLPPALLDGKILFNTAARDASVPNGVGLGQAAPLFNAPRRFCVNDPGQACRSDPDCPGSACGGATNMPGEVVSTSHDASYVSCTACHADFGGQDGRTWDFSQFGASLRNTMDLRGRAGFAPGHCSQDETIECFFDVACGDGNTCRANPAMVPPNIIGPADRARWFNPMLTVHWNGDRDEVEDFEHTYRQLQGSADCDAAEDTPTCPGALVQRSALTTVEPPRTNTRGEQDAEPDLGAPNRNLPGATTGKNVGFRLTHVADFVYSLTSFVKNPNGASDAVARGREIFNDPLTQCGDCHTGGPGAGRQFFTDKRPNPDFDPSVPPGPDRNNPFIRHDVGTANFFDLTDPNLVASESQIFQNSRIPIPGIRGGLGDYVTPVLVDLWNTRPYLHDGSAHSLLDVVRPCETTIEDCFQLGKGRALHQGGQGRHGKTDVLTPSQLNDLVAFQLALTTGTSLGTRRSVVKPGTMTFTNARVNFGKVRKGVRKRGSFKIAGSFGGAPVAVDPGTGVSLEVATPNGDGMAVLPATFAMQPKGKRFAGRAAVGTGSVKLKLAARKNGTFRFALAGKKLDLGPLDTGNPDLTVALISSGAQFVRNQTLAKKKGIYRLPKKRKRRR